MAKSCNCSQTQMVISPKPAGLTTTCGYGGDPTLNTMVFYIPEANLELNVPVEVPKIVYDRFIKFCNVNSDNVDEIIVDSYNQVKYYVNGFTQKYDDIFHGVSVFDERGQQYFFYAKIDPDWSSEDGRNHYWFYMINDQTASCPDSPGILTTEEILGIFDPIFETPKTPELNPEE